MIMCRAARRPSLATFTLLCFVALAVLGLARARAEVDLERAYKREKAQLLAEKKALTASHHKLVAAQKGRRAALRKEIDTLVARLTATRSKVELSRRQIQSTQKQLDTQDDKKSSLASVVDQAEALLARYKVKLASPAASKAPSAQSDAVIGAALLGRLYRGGAGLLKRHASVRWETGAFFGPDGKEHRGRLLRFGQVATYAEGKGLRGPLAPAGGGHLKLHPMQAPKATRVGAYLAGAGGDEPVPLFLYDALDKRRASRVDKTIWQTLKAGGVVVWPILALGLLALLILLERAFTLQRVHSRANVLPVQVCKLVERREWKAAQDASDERHGAVAHVLRAILRNRHLERPALHDAINEAILDQLPRLQRFIPVLSVIAAVAPLLGLLGTVTGMISTFDVITEHGTGDPKLLSGGISEALVTTEVGLIVAIPVLLIHSVLSGRVEHIVSDMENNALKVSNQIIRQRQQWQPELCPADGSPCPHAVERGVPERSDADGDLPDRSPAAPRPAEG
jgi:biopolymer transport protein ExbB